MESLSGRELKQLRESKGITLADAARGTRLRSSIIEAIETDGSCDLLAPIYQDLSRRTYARFLADACGGELRENEVSSAILPQAPQGRSKRGPSSPT